MIKSEAIQNFLARFESIACEYEGHFDEVAETLLLDHIVRHVKFKIRRLLGEYRRPSVETSDVLPFQLPTRRGRLRSPLSAAEGSHGWISP